MKFLIAPSNLKDCLPAKDVAGIIENSIQKVLPYAEIKTIPMADGGEGTVEAIVDALKGTYHNAIVSDPFMRPVEAIFGLVDENKTAILEMAAASGIQLLKLDERNPLRTNTFGTGELIKAALNKGCKKIILGVGGSSTNDAGVGALMALGIKFYNSKGDLLSNIGGKLTQINYFDTSEIDQRLTATELQIACDVVNPMTGPDGASLVFSHQKGADKAMSEFLELNLQHFAMLINKQIGININEYNGSGAAGGLGGGLMAFTNARLISGFEIIRDITKLEDQIKWADIIITGEGKIDNTTKFGKTPAGIARLAKQLGKPVIAIAGILGKDHEELLKEGFTSIHCISDGTLEIEESIKRAPELIENTMKNILRNIEDVF